VKKMEERIASMEQQLKTLKERHQKAETKRKRDEAQLARKNDARRKVLVGTVVLEKVERGEINDAQFRKWLDGALTEPDDRALFNLDSARKSGAQAGFAGVSHTDRAT
jgi:hypothetical protein